MNGRPRAGIYCRMSLAIMDDTTKVDDQASICRDLCERRGWDVAEVYIDNNRSAWKHNRKRPGWDRMLADVKDGKLDTIVVYHGDRLVRQPRDLEDLLDLSRGKGIRLASPTGERNLDNDDDQYILSIEAAGFRRESAATSRRKKGEYERLRRAGRVRPGGRGGRPTGFETDGVTHIPAEVKWIKDAGYRVLNGEPTMAIARELSARGCRTPTGSEVTHSTLRKMLSRPRYAGLMPDGIHQAAWPAVFERETWEAICAVLGAKSAGFAYATNARRYLLSGIARCGACGHPLAINSRASMGQASAYRCIQPGCRRVYRSQPQLDVFVSAAAVAKLNDPANPPGRVPRNTAVAGEFAALMRQRADVEAAIVDPAVGPHLPLLLRRLSSVDARLAQLRDMAAGSARVRLLASHAGVTRAAFDALPLAARRSLIAALFTVTVLPASKRGPGFRPQDVRLTPPGMP